MDSLEIHFSSPSLTGLGFTGIEVTLVPFLTLLSAAKILMPKNAVPISSFGLNPVRSINASFNTRNFPFSSTITAGSTVKFRSVMKLFLLLFLGPILHNFFHRD